jgi:hypothetical protein
LIVAVFAVPPAMAAHIVLGGIILQSIWYLAIAALLVKRDGWAMTGESKLTYGVIR